MVGLLAPGLAFNSLILRSDRLVRQVYHAGADAPARREPRPVVQLCRHCLPRSLRHGWNSTVGGELSVEVAHRRGGFADASLVAEHL